MPADLDQVFKAYDVRGLYPEELREDVFQQLGRAFAAFLGPGTVAVTRDMRLSSPSLSAAFIDGVLQLHGCAVRACDLRAGAAMVIAAMAADGLSIIEDAHYIERGYEDIIGKLTSLGAQIRRVEVKERHKEVQSVG